MNTIKASILLLFLIFLTNCGYSPLLNLENVNFKCCKFEGRKANNVISKTVKYQNSEATKNKIEINTNYNKMSINRTQRVTLKIMIFKLLKVKFLWKIDNINKVFQISTQSKNI